MASTRRPRALPAYLCALLVVCALASSAFAAQTFQVNLSATTDDLTGFYTGNTSNNPGDLPSENPALTHLINQDSIKFVWSTPAGRIAGTHLVQQTDRDCKLDSGCLTVTGGFASALSSTAGFTFTITSPAPSGTDYFYDCGNHGPLMNGHFHVDSFGALDHFAVIIPSGSTQTAGTAFSVTIQARDRNDNVVVGSFSVTMSNPTGSGAVFSPVTVNLVNGVGSTSANIHSSGNQTIHASGVVVGDAFITVNPSAATHYLVAAPATGTAGQNVNFQVTAQDQFNNTATGYAGTVHFTSSDGTAVKPADSTLVSGTKGFGITFNTAGSQTIVATDTVTGSITGSDTVTVNSSNCPSADKIFTNSAAITIPDTPGTSNFYPSSINVSGLVNQVVGKVTVTLHGFHHTFVSDIDVMLVGPGGQKLALMSNAAFAGGAS